MPLPLVHDFIKAIDREWKHASRGKISLPVIGSTALMLQADYERGTKDSDVLQTGHLDERTERRLLALAGPATKLSAQHRLYVQIVPGALPFLPQAPRWLELPGLNAELEHFRVEVLHVVDVVVSKLKRFHGADASDIDAMVTLGLVSHELLLERFRLAVDAFSMDSRADELPKYIANLHRVERDMLDVPETAIELPDWLDSSV